MYIKNDIKTSIVLWFSWRYIVFFFLYTAAAYAAFQYYGLKSLAIPFLPVGTIGTAVAFYIGFKNNSSYERLWEGRKIWGAIGSLSRAFAGVLVAGIDKVSKPVKERRIALVKRQIYYCHTLAMQLRISSAERKRENPAPEVSLVKKLCSPPEHSQKTLDDYLQTNLSRGDYEQVKRVDNKALALLRLQLSDIEGGCDDLQLSDHALERLTEILVSLFSEQGACERLKNFPFPRQYAHFSNVFVWIFLLLLPFGLIDELSKSAGGTLVWTVIPFGTLISWMFITMEQVGDSSEDPFELGLNDVPISALARSIEIDLLQFTGDQNIPANLEPVADILL